MADPDRSLARRSLPRLVLLAMVIGITVVVVLAIRGDQARARCEGIALDGAFADLGRQYPSSGELVRQVQERLVELGQGDAIAEGGGIDGQFDQADLDAFLRWVAVNDYGPAQGTIFVDDRQVVGFGGDWLPLLGVECP